MKIGIIGAGAVGSTAAYYLSKDKSNDVTVFDYGVGQATKAAAGIICPWFSKRRNKTWYRLARLGADFYQELLSDLENEGIPNDFYQQSGVFIFRKQEDKLEELYEIALDRKCESPLIGELKFLSYDESQNDFPNLFHFKNTLYSSGAARVEGSKLTNTLLKNSKIKFIKKKVSLKRVKTRWQIENELFDTVILASGAWLKELLEPLGYSVDCRPQKGQLRDYYFEHLNTRDYPVLMPEGEIDIIPFPNGKISVGASHENEKGFDLSIDKEILTKMEKEALSYYPNLSQYESKQERVGIRAYTSDYSPFFGLLPEESNIYVASGLGSTGLTIGPLIGKEIAMHILQGTTKLNFNDYSADKYVTKMKK